MSSYNYAFLKTSFLDSNSDMRTQKEKYSQLSYLFLTTSITCQNNEISHTENKIKFMHEEFQIISKENFREKHSLMRQYFGLFFSSK